MKKTLSNSIQVEKELRKRSRNTKKKKLFLNFNFEKIFVICKNSYWCLMRVK